MFSGGIRTMDVSEVALALVVGQPRPADGVYRVETDSTGDAWICTPNYRRIAKLRRRMKDPARDLLSARFVPGDSRAVVRRCGPSHGAVASGRLDPLSVVQCRCSKRCSWVPMAAKRALSHWQLAGAVLRRFSSPTTNINCDVTAWRP
jgi:hypothetical protein